MKLRILRRFLLLTLFMSAVNLGAKNAEILTSYPLTRIVTHLLLNNQSHQIRTLEEVNLGKQVSEETPLTLFLTHGMGTERALQDKFFSHPRFKMIQAGHKGYCQIGNRVNVILYSYDQGIKTKFPFGNPHFLYSPIQATKALESILECFINKYPDQKFKLEKKLQAIIKGINKLSKRLKKYEVKTKRAITLTEEFDYLLRDVKIEPFYIPPTQLNSKYAQNQIDLLSYQKSEFIILSSTQKNLISQLKHHKHLSKFKIILLNPPTGNEDFLISIKNLAMPLFVD